MQRSQQQPSHQAQDSVQTPCPPPRHSVLPPRARLPRPLQATASASASFRPRGPCQNKSTQPFCWEPSLLKGAAHLPGKPLLCLKASCSVAQSV